MAVTHIAHYNFRLSRELLAVVKDFYVDVVGLTNGERPPFQNMGYWLYAGEKDVLHLTEEAADDPREIDSHLTFDHVALACTDWPTHQARLKAHGVVFTIEHVPQRGHLQVFFRDPAGNGVELIFFAGDLNK